MRELIRTVRFTPYRKGMGPRFTLRLYDIGRTDRLGKDVVGYELLQTSPKANGRTRNTMLFQGEDFACSPLHAIDSDACVESLMGFLTLKKGDTDKEYFDNYTPGQLAFSEEHAESLEIECMNRFVEEL